MHIAYLTSEYITGPVRGGLATYLENMSMIMSEHGHDVTVISLAEKKEEFYYADKIKVITVRAGKDFTKARTQMGNSWRIYCELMKLHRHIPVDIVHATSLISIGLFRNYRIPTIVRISNDGAMNRHTMLPEFDFKKAMKEKSLTDLLQLFTVRSADRVFAPSNCYANIVSRRARVSVDVIESPYRCNDIVWDYKIYEKKLKGKEYLLVNSSLSYYKGTHLILQATEEILRKYPQLYIVYAGVARELSGIPIKEILRKQNRKYNGRVLYLGNLTHEQLFPVVECAKACVMPARLDNLPNSCVEAMSLGKIVIGTYGGSFEQLIKNKHNGLLIKRESVKGLIKAVDYLYQLSEEECQIMGEHAKETVKRMEPDVIYEKMINYYQKVIREFKKK